MTTPRPDMERAGLARRLAAILYDTLVFIAVLLVATVPFVLIARGAPTSEAGEYLFRFYVLALAFLFFGWFWIHGGQTLGMRAWRLRVVNDAGGALSWSQALRRFLGAILSWMLFGAGYFWILIDHDKRAWHDRLSGTRMIVIPKTADAPPPSPPSAA